MVRSTVRKNGYSGKSSSLRIRYVWLPGTAYHLQWSIRFRISIRNIVLYHINNGVAYCPSWKPRILETFLLTWLIKILDGIFHAKLMTVMISLMFTVRIIRIVPSEICTMNPLSNTEVFSATISCERSPEFLIASIV